MTDSHQERTAELRKIRTYVHEAEGQIAPLKIIPRIPSRFPFDIVGLAILSKAFALAKACLKLLTTNHIDEGFGLSRSLVECTTNLRFLTSDLSKLNNRSRDFVNFALADKAFWYHHALKSAKTPKERSELQAYAKQMGISDNPKLARQHWSGQGSSFVWDTTLLEHPLDGPSTADFRKKAYAVDYYQASTYVHCSLPAIDNYFVEDGIPFHIAPASSHRDVYQSTLFIVLFYIHHAMAYVLYGMNLDRPAKLNLLFQNTLQRMKPIPVRHKRK